MDATDFFIEDGSPFASHKHKETTRMWVTQRGGEKRQETVMTEVELDNVSDDYIGYSMSTRRSMDRVDETKINYDLIEDVLLRLLVDKVPSDVLVPPAGVQLQSGAVLIFLPGIGEIRTLSERLQSNRVFGDTRRFEVIPMHSALSGSDQRRAFIVPRKVEWAIIVATNIAETSVTIPDAVCGESLLPRAWFCPCCRSLISCVFFVIICAPVIDSGRVREVRHDKRTLTRKLVTDWCSRASAKQRGGRAGRVQPGICLKLFSSQTEKSMNAATEPELKRLPLEEVCLTILAGGFARNCVEFLGQTPQPPGDDAVRLALSVLADIGAVAFAPDSTELLTPLGRHLAKLPVDCRLGKMLIFGVILQCIDTIATVVAGLSASQSLFVTSLNDGQLAKAKKAAFTYPNSDFLTLVNVYEAYTAADKIGKGRQFCRENYVSLSALREIKDGRKHYLELLRGIGFSIINKLDPTAACTISGGGYRKDEGVIHAVICAGLYPNVARIDRTPSGGDSIWHKKERLYIHSSSVSAKLPRYLQSPWLAFHEKFGTTSRVSMSTCCFVHPFALLLFGGALEVRHAERRVIVDNWIELSLAAKTGVIFAELRRHIDAMLEAAVQSADGSFLDKQDVANIVQAIVGLLS
jgi:HrpA-like RNA helicase